jgi:hypothetical protein
MEILRGIRGHGFEPKIPSCVNSLPKRNVTSPDNPATGSKAQTRSPEQQADDGAPHSGPSTTSNQQQRNSSGICSNELGNGSRSFVHSRVAFAKPLPVVVHLSGFSFGAHDYGYSRPFSHGPID